MNAWKEEFNLSEKGKLFQSDGALNLKARLPNSLKILGTMKKKGWWAFQKNKIFQNLQWLEGNERQL